MLIKHFNADKKFIKHAESIVRILIKVNMLLHKTVSFNHIIHYYNIIQLAVYKI